MRTLVVYRTNTEYERDVDAYMREFHYRTGKDLERLDPDTKDGSAFCRAYDIVEYPTIISLDDIGKMQSVWRGMPLPLIDEVSYYVQ